MAKDNQKQVAYTLYVDKCMTAKDIAAKLKVTEKTIGEWVRKGNWKEIRLAKQATPELLASKYNELLNSLLDQRLEIEKTPGLKPDNYYGIIDEMSKVAAMIDRLQKDGTLSLRTHILVLEKFMAALHQNNPQIFMQLIDFQKEYLTLLSQELK